MNLNNRFRHQGPESYLSEIPENRALFGPFHALIFHFENVIMSIVEIQAKQNLHYSLTFYNDISFALPIMEWRIFMFDRTSAMLAGAAILQGATAAFNIAASQPLLAVLSGVPALGFAVACGLRAYESSASTTPPKAPTPRHSSRSPHDNGLLHP